MTNTIQNVSLCVDNIQIPSMISELSWMNQSDLCSGITTMKMTEIAETVTTTMTTTTTTTTSSSSTSSTSCSDYHFDGSHHLHMLFRYPHKYIGKIPKNIPKLKQNQESDLKYHQIQSNNDLRIKLERELSQKVRQAVKTPPRERIIRRRLNEFHYEINKRLKSEEKKKQLVIQMNDKLNFNVTTNTTNTNISSLNNMNNINVMDLRMHPESYYQHLNWSKKSNINMNSQSILWNKNNDSFINCISNNTTYSKYLIHKLHNYKNTILNLKQSLLPISSIHSSTSNQLEYNHEYDQLLNDTFTFDWNINGSNIDRDQSINNDHNDDRNDDDHDLDHTIINHIHKYYQMRSSYLTDEDIQLIHKYYEKLYKNKRILDRMNRKLCDHCEEYMVVKAAYLMATIQSQYKLPDGTQYRLMNQSTNKPLDYVIINNSFIDQTINDSSSSSSKLDNFNNDNTQTTDCSFNTLPTLIDWNAVVRDRHGPFWPQNYGPIFNKPTIPDYTEEMNQLKKKQPYFKEIRVIFDSECSPCLSGTSSTSISSPLDIKQLVEELTNNQQWTPPCLVFESRFESGNLRQVRRIGPFHYELLLKPDLYTKRHVQWYFFRIQNILPGFIYTFLIFIFPQIGLQPLLYSKMNYQQNGKKWIRVGRNIKYTRNTMNLSNHLLDTNSEYYQLEWEMIKGELSKLKNIVNIGCSLTGRDLNRNYRQPKKDVFPTVWTVKQLVKWCKKTYKDVIYCDMHGHSRRNNIFMYGCDPLYRHSKIFNNTKKSLHERILPYIISQQVSLIHKSYDFIKSQLYTTNKQFFQSTINNDQFNHNNNKDSILNYSLNDPDQIDGDQSDHDQMNDSLEQLAKAIHVLEKSIELHNIELNENELYDYYFPFSSFPFSTSDSNSDSEPEMTITDQNSLNQYYNLRGDLILTNQIQTILLDQSKQLKQSNNTDHDITRSYKLKKRKKNKKKKLQTLHDRHLRHHHHHHPRHHHHHHHQFSSIQKQSYKNISSNQSQNNDNSTIHSKQLSSNSTSLSPPLPPSSSSTSSSSSLSPIEGKRTLSEQRLTFFQLSFQLETKISKLKSTDNVTNIDVLKYLKQIHLEAKHQLQLIQSQLIDKNHPYKSTMIHETMTTITNNIGIPYPPPLPNFTTTGHHIKTHSAIITTTNNSTAKRNMSIGGGEGRRIERNNNDLIPRSRSCNLFLRNNHNNNNINNNGNNKNNKLLELPKIIEKISENNIMYHSRNNSYIPDGINIKV
ncbi:uncharacterized protein DC041_0010953 [Schistosoma bovis]|uniref:Cytosolic carboxypeptidase N-terminal domain-containing protein n=1 Tax=Schistosoma bovis TaxID=6184 RepID=A0A430QID0_SCHBO|nr:uncharacterized protein DC041_0010953 [Schistosoma bovis]